MRRATRALGALLGIVVAGALSACVAPSQVVADSTVTIVTDTELGVVNPGSTRSAAVTRLGVDLALYSGFAAVDDRGNPVSDPSFGAFIVLDQEPLTVRYTVSDAARWSDGTPVDAVDLLLDWAAHADRWAAFSATRGGGAGGITALPTLSPDRKSLTVVFDAASSAAPERQFMAPMPSHVVARGALGIEDTEAAKDAVIAAITTAVDGDDAALMRLGTFWTRGFTVDAGPEVLVSSGPYKVAEVAERAVELRPNPRYAGDHRPRIQSVRLVTLPPLEGLQALVADAADLLAIGPNAGVEELAPGLGLRLLASGPGASTLIVAQRQTVAGVEVGADGRRLLWGVAEWTPTR
ncbi:MAG TPA: ABC transporter substrate-binding protein [Microbacteriaceae bacterium]|nr:ABC transporter substrate-binding protein [Microbacteriaceae bacterium]